MNARIVCLGNRYTAADDLGPRVYDWLAARALPPNVDVVDGGLGGLDLAPIVERSRRVVFVDAVVGLAAPDEVLVLDAAALAREAAGEAGEVGYGHGGGLAYLLRALPIVCASPPPCALVGAAAPASQGLVARVAARALGLAGSPEEGAVIA
ncbi:MAG: hydrogenase maturation protease [Myxococcales bacterium]|nr:hydrogenase maturation protease [Myxococcales bacterium]